MANSLDSQYAYGEIRAASTAGGGTALTTSYALVTLIPGTEFITITPRNFSTAVVAKVALTPWITVLVTSDNLVTATNYSSDAQDGSASTDVGLSSLPTLASSGMMLIGADVPFRGVKVDVDNVNSTVSVLTVKYWNGSAYADISASDGTTSGGATFAQDGDVTWTVPTAWTAAKLTTIASPAPGSGVALRSTLMYWTRWEVSVALDSNTTLNSIMALARSTAYAELISGETKSTRVSRANGGCAGVEALTDAGTANLIVNCHTSIGNIFS